MRRTIAVVAAAAALTLGAASPALATPTHRHHGYTRIRAAHRAWCVTRHHRAVVIAPCDGSRSQRWHIHGQRVWAAGGHLVLTVKPDGNVGVPVLRRPGRSHDRWAVCASGQLRDTWLTSKTGVIAALVWPAVPPVHQLRVYRPDLPLAANEVTQFRVAQSVKHTAGC